MVRLLALGAALGLVLPSVAAAQSYYPTDSGLSFARSGQGAPVLVQVASGIRRAGVRFGFRARCTSGRVERAVAAMALLRVRRGEAEYDTFAGKLVTRPRGWHGSRITAVQRVVGLLQTPQALGYLSVSLTVRRAGKVVDRCSTGRVSWHTPDELFDSYAVGLLKLPR